MTADMKPNGGDHTAVILGEGERGAGGDKKDAWEATPGNGKIDGTLVSGDDTMEGDASNVRFISGSKEEESRADIEESGGKTSGAFVGLRKEELADFATDPYWVRLRIALLVIFIITWLAMLIAAIVIIVYAPKCPPRPQLDWWQTAVVYHIHPVSFKDSDGDGSGDIKGIQSKVLYLGANGLKVSAVNLGPMYPSPVLDNGYDVMNYMGICPHRYGTFVDFDSLVSSLHKAGVKLILDFIPNHTSRRHKWFQMSRNVSHPDHSLYRDFYVWKNGRNNDSSLPPNDWLDVSGGSAWQLDETRSQFYYHTYAADEPDLNLRNPAVLRNIEDALHFWLKRKVDGFRMIGAQYLYEPSDMIDQSEVGFQRESYELVTGWRRLLDDFSRNDGRSKSQSFPRLLIVDVQGSTNQTAPFSQYNNTAGAHVVTNKALLGLNESCSAQCVLELIQSSTTGASTTSFFDETTTNWWNWQVGNYDTSRVVSRYGGDMKYVNAVNLLLLTLPGTALVYYGDEIGMKDWFPLNATKGGQLSPMQWDSTPNAGFTSGLTPWAPVANNYPDVNVETEKAHGSGLTRLSAFTEFVKLRYHESIQWGSFRPIVFGNILMFIRAAEGFDRILVAINFGPGSTTVNIGEVFKSSESLPEHAEVVTSTSNFDSAMRMSAFRVGVKVPLNKALYLNRAEGVVLSWKPQQGVMSFLTSS